MAKHGEAWRSKTYLEDVEHARHSHKDEYAVSALLEALEQFIKDGELARVVHNVLALDEGRPRLGPVKEVRVVAHLAQVHDDVLHRRHTGSGLAVAGKGAQVPHEHLAVPLGLHRREGEEDLGLGLGRQTLFDVRFEPSQEAAL